MGAMLLLEYPQTSIHLSPFDCRRLSADRQGQTTGVGRPSPQLCVPGENSSASVPADPHMHVPARAGSGILSLARSLRHRRLLLLGDSVTGQVGEALQCLAGSMLPGGVRPYEHRLEDPRLVESCRRLFALRMKYVKARERCRKCYRGRPSRRLALRECPTLDDMCREVPFGAAAATAWAHLAWPCWALSPPLPHSRRQAGKPAAISLRGFVVPAFNLSVLPLLGSQMDRWPSDALRQRARVPADPHWPSRIEFADRHDLADAIVLNLGLHYPGGNQAAASAATSTAAPTATFAAPAAGTEEGRTTQRDLFAESRRLRLEYGSAMEAAFRELETFAARRPFWRRAVVRETSAQHFSSREEGSYESASVSARSMDHASCQTAAAENPLCTQPCRPHAHTNASHASAPRRSWRNRIIHELAAQSRQRADGRWAAPQVQAFEALTAARWDYHVASKTAFDAKTSRHIFDCTHFCYSPSFWQQSMNDLARVVAEITTDETKGQ